MPHLPAALLWDVFCRVIDNHGDLGVCWRLAADLARRGQRVRLWVDDASALAWMAPGAREGHHRGITVLPWTTPLPPERLRNLPRSDVWIEAFGCDIAPEFIAQQRHGSPGDGEKAPKPPVWINLEYLSAEAWVERSHTLPSPVLQGPGEGWTKTFFFPGFTTRTGGLLREADLPARQAAFDPVAWRAAHTAVRPGERVFSLFCYEPPALGGFLAALRAGTPPTRVLVTPGRATAAVQAAEKDILGKNSLDPASNGESSLSISYLPPLTQIDFDHLLWASDCNLVRGEDSLVRALWAGRPLVWQIYPQHDQAHHAKLEAFLDWLDAPASLQHFHRVWNGITGGPLPVPDLPGWGEAVRAARARLLAQDDLLTQLLGFVAKKR